jgi:predicted permease
MSLLRSIAGGLRSLFRREQVSQDLDEELSGFLEMATEEKMKQGMSREDALRVVRLERGSLEVSKEVVRSAGWESFVETSWQDIRYSLRMLAKNPGFTGVAVLTLALGIGANTAIFSLLNAVMLSSVPVHDPQHLVVLKWSARSTPNWGYSNYGDCDDSPQAVRVSGCSLSYPVFREIRSKANVFSGFAAFAGPRQLSLSGNGPASIATAELVSGDYFGTLGVSSALGRTLQPTDEAPNAESVVVLSYGYWRAAFGGNVSAVGKTVRLNGASFTIVGVAEPRFTRLSPGKTGDMWISLTQVSRLNFDWGAGLPEDPSHWWLATVARLNPSVSAAQAQAAVNLLFRDAALHGDKPVFKDANDPGMTVVPAQEGLIGIRSDLGAPIYILMAAVGVVLLIACANVAGLLLARGSAREREVAVRLALGAGRGRIVRQLLTESVLLAAAGAALGILFASWGAYSLAAFVSANWPSQLVIDVNPDARVLGFTAAVATLTGIVFGLAPAFRSARVEVTPTLKERAGNLSNTSRAGSNRFRLSSSLVVAQVALSVLVLVGSGLLVRTLVNLKSIDPGFDTHNVLLFGIDPTQAGYEPSRIQNLYRDLQTQLAAVPGVLSASYSRDVLLDGSRSSTLIHIEGHSDAGVVSEILSVGPGFFETMRIPVLEGRAFVASDLDSTHAVAIVNESFARKFSAGRNPLGMHFGDPGTKGVGREIVGIVGDTKYDQLRKDVEPTAYVPLRAGSAHFALRTAGDTAAIIPALRHIVDSESHDLPLFDLRTQSETVDRLLFGERLVARLSALFGILALALASIGLYGLLSYEVLQRTREIGIRSALGAQQRDVLRLVVGQGMGLALAGVVLGVCVAFGVTRYLQSLLYGVRPSDPTTFAGVALLLTVVALVACGVPARRAARVDPVVALRYE